MSQEDMVKEAVEEAKAKAAQTVEEESEKVTEEAVEADGSRLKQPAFTYAALCLWGHRAA